MTRSSRWATLPGSFDALHAHHCFPTDNRWGIPTLPRVPRTAVPAWLVPYRQRIRSQQPLTDGAVHFFLDDRRFESVWNRPHRALPALAEYKTVLTPDFSLYRDWPLTLQLWNTYRSRWCGAFWQSHGWTVIPTVSWGAADSLAFCFAGLPTYSVVAIGSVGIRWEQVLDVALFRAGLERLVGQFRPTVLLCYGTLPAEIVAWVTTAGTQVKMYPTRWATIRRARREGVVA